MFNDDLSFALNKMHDFSPAEGFVEIADGLADMIKFVANEPSVGLFYIQQHTQNAVPNLINLKNNVTEKSREMTLHTEDIDDSITMVNSMKECGLPIAGAMIEEITKSLAIVTTKQPKKGLICGSSSNFQMGRTSSWGPSTWGRNAVYAPQDGGGANTYLSSVLKSAKERASNFKWLQLDSKEFRQHKVERPVPYPTPPLSVAAGSSISAQPDAESDELPVSSQTADELQQEKRPVDASLSKEKLLSLSENYEEFRAHRQAKLEEWLGKTGNEVL